MRLGAKQKLPECESNENTYNVNDRQAIGKSLDVNDLHPNDK
jgi:hypothetical protein